MKLKGENQKINVLILPDLFPKNEKDWVGVFVVDYVKSIASQCNPIVFYSRLIGDDTPLKSERFNTSFDVYRWNYKTKITPILKPLFYLFWFFKTAKQVQQTIKNVDVIHAHGAILNGTVAYLLSKRLNVPFVISEHTGPFSKVSNSFVKRNWAKYILNKANKVLTVSNHLKQEILDIGVHQSKIEVTYNPVDTNLFTLKENKILIKNILFVSRLEPFKGGLRTLKSFHQLLQKEGDWNLTICGEGVEKQAILQYITKNKLKDKVTIKGTLTKKELAKEIHKAAFLVYPSLHESFGLIPVEAMSCGIPVICTNQTAPKEYINAANGLLVHPNNIDEIAQAMQTLINNLSAYDAGNIRKQIVERFGFDNFGKNLIKIYSNIRWVL